MARTENSGFSLGGDDINDLMKIAAKGEESDDFGDEGIFDGNDSGTDASPADHGVRQTETVPEVEETVVRPVEKPAEDYNADVYERSSEAPSEPSYTTSAPVDDYPQQTVEEFHETYDNPDDQQYVQETYQPEPQYVPEPPRTYTPKRPNIRSTAEFIGEASKIIRVLDVYRSLSDDVKQVAAQFIYNDNDVDPGDEATLVVRVIDADDMLSKTMKNLQKSASQNERVQRAFYILRLPDDELRSLGDLVFTLTEIESPDFGDRIRFSQQVEESVNQLDKKIIEYVAATESVLQAGK